jgi:serine/threonine-protein phosphatase PGAM5
MDYGMMVNRTLYLVRHGQYDSGRRDEGDLSTLGRQQAEFTALFLRNIPFSRLYYSPVRRASETARIIAAHMPEVSCIEDEKLRECIPSIPRQHAALFADRYPEITPERVKSCMQRMDDIYDQYFRPIEDQRNGKEIHELFVCHGNVIRYLVSRVLGASADAWTSMLIHHCGLTRVTIDHNGQIYLVSHNDIGHLSDELRTEN